MKAIDLMIDDWIHSNYTNENYQVSSAFFNRVTNFGRDLDATFEDINIAPVPLTSEILEKNGFIHDEEDEISFYDKDCVFIKKSSGGFGARLDKNCTISGSFYYVHELQHALKLCGIEKEIIL